MNAQNSMPKVGIIHFASFQLYGKTWSSTQLSAVIQNATTYQESGPSSALSDQSYLRTSPKMLFWSTCYLLAICSIKAWFFLSNNVSAICRVPYLVILRPNPKITTKLTHVKEFGCFDGFCQRDFIEELLHICLDRLGGFRLFDLLKACKLS